MAKNYRSTPGPSLRYDARGQLVKSKPKSRVLHFILCYLLPYLIINGLILLFVIQQPTIRRITRRLRSKSRSIPWCR